MNPRMTFRHTLHATPDADEGHPVTAGTSRGGVDDAGEDDTGEEAGMREIVQDFLEGLPVRIEAMRASRAGSDPDGLLALVHRLKGTAAAVGFGGLADACLEIERSVARRDSRRTDELIGELERFSRELIASTKAG